MPTTVSLVLRYTWTFLAAVARDPDRDALADVQVQDRGRLVGGHHLVRPRRVGGPALGDLQPVLVGEQPVRAGDELHLGLQDRLDPAVRRQRRRVDLLALLGAAHVRQPGQLVRTRPGSGVLVCGSTNRSDGFVLARNVG